MNFYDFLKQKYDNYKVIKWCEACPCKILRNKMLGDMPRRTCIEEIMYLADKCNIHDFDASLCRDNMITSLKIAKKWQKILTGYKNEFLSAYQTAI